MKSVDYHIQQKIRNKVELAVISKQAAAEAAAADDPGKGNPGDSSRRSRREQTIQETAADNPGDSRRSRRQQQTVQETAAVDPGDSRRSRRQ